MRWVASTWVARIATAHPRKTKYNYKRKKAAYLKRPSSNGTEVGRRYSISIVTRPVLRSYRPPQIFSLPMSIISLREDVVLS